VSGLPGPGDPATWPPSIGHPLDPRTVDYDSHDEMCDDPDCEGEGECIPVLEPDYEAMMDDRE
jgi:hypothetical protein